MFVKVVLLPIIENEELDDDVRALATGVLGTWGKIIISFLLLLKYQLKLLSSFIANS